MGTLLSKMLIYGLAFGAIAWAGLMLTSLYFQGMPSILLYVVSGCCAIIGAILGGGSAVIDKATPLD